MTKKKKTNGFKKVINQASLNAESWKTSQRECTYIEDTPFFFPERVRMTYLHDICCCICASQRESFVSFCKSKSWTNYGHEIPSRHFLFRAFISVILWASNIPRKKLQPHIFWAACQISLIIHQMSNEAFFFFSLLPNSLLTKVTLGQFTAA